MVWPLIFILMVLLGAGWVLWRWRPAARWHVYVRRIALVVLFLNLLVLLLMLFGVIGYYFSLGQGVVEGLAD